jgi:hypothetical protein
MASDLALAEAPQVGKIERQERVPARAMTIASFSIVRMVGFGCLGPSGRLEAPKSLRRVPQNRFWQLAEIYDSCRGRKTIRRLII